MWLFILIGINSKKVDLDLAIWSIYILNNNLFKLKKLWDLNYTEP